MPSSKECVSPFRASYPSSELNSRTFAHGARSARQKNSVGSAAFPSRRLERGTIAIDAGRRRRHAHGGTSRKRPGETVEQSLKRLMCTCRARPPPTPPDITAALEVKRAAHKVEAAPSCKSCVLTTEPGSQLSLRGGRA